MAVALNRPAVDRRWWLALAASLMLHAVVVSGPGWRVPTLDDLMSKEDYIEARLLPPPLPAAPSLPPAPPSAAAEPVPPPRPKASRPSRTVAPGRPAASTLGVPILPVTPASPVEAPAAEVAATPPPAASPPPPAASSTLPKRARVRYGIAMGGRGFIVGRAEHRWTLDGASYTLRATAETTGLAALFKPVAVNQISEGDVLAEGLRPRVFRVERGGTAGDSVNFDWPGGRVAMSPGPRDSAAEPGMQDLLSLYWHLGLMPVSATGMAVTVATGKKIERYVFALAGEEKIGTALGERAAIRIKTVGTSGGDATELWIDTERRVPLRIRHVDRKGEIFDQTIEELEMQ